jgi:hypothetical protein
MARRDDNQVMTAETYTFEWTLLDLSELWQSIGGDAAIHPDDRRAVLAAALRGESDWYERGASVVNLCGSSAGVGCSSRNLCG